MRGRLLQGTLVLAAVLSLLAGCGTSSDASDATSTAPSTVPTTTLPPTTTEPPRATGGAPTSAQAAADLVAAWENDDPDGAAHIADALAVMGIFAVPDDAMWIRGCTTDDSIPEGGCVYRAESGLIQINTEKRAQGWVVVSAVYDPLDNGNETYGDAPEAPGT